MSSDADYADYPPGCTTADIGGEGMLVDWVGEYPYCSGCDEQLPYYDLTRAAVGGKRGRYCDKCVASDSSDNRELGE